MSKMQVKFCQIDARDNYYCGYNPVAFADEDGPLELGPNNGKLAVLMEREYLTRLSALQVEISEKYKALFDVNEKSPEDEGLCYSNGLKTKEEFEAARDEAEKMFPGKEAEYYT